MSGGGRIETLTSALGAAAVGLGDDGGVRLRPDSAAQLARALGQARAEGWIVRTAPARSVADEPYPAAGELLLTTERIQAPLELDERSGIVTVAAGTTGAELAWRLHREGRWIEARPLPFLREPIGGYLAGPGLAGEMVAFTPWESPLLGVRAVLADGRRLRIGVAPRSAAGPDYRAFLLGAGDSLGVITSVVWRTLARGVVQLSALRFDRDADALAVARAHTADGWRPLASRVIRGAEAASWGAPTTRGRAAVLLLAHRAEGTRGEQLTRQLGALAGDHGGLRLAADEARPWFEATYLAPCRRGASALPAASAEPVAGEIGRGWLAVPWCGLPALWDAVVRRRNGPLHAAACVEALRPEGGIIEVPLVRRGAARTTLATAADALLRLAAEHGARLVGLHDVDGEPRVPVTAPTPSSRLLAAIADELGAEATLNPRSGEEV